MRWSEIRFWDWVSIRRFVAFFAIMIALFYFMANRGHFAMLFNQRNMYGVTKGWIINRGNLSSNAQRLTGNSKQINGVLIDFSYKVEGKYYHQQQILTYSLIDAPKLNIIVTQKLPLAVKVKYETQHPQNSSISLD